MPFNRFHRPCRSTDRLPRNVYSYQLQPSGEIAYFAITSTGAVLNRELRRRLSGETEALLLRELWRDLDRQDPVALTRPPLTLYVDGAPAGPAPPRPPRPPRAEPPPDLR